MPTNIRIYKKRPGEAKDVGISTSACGPGAGVSGHVTISLNVKDESETKVRLNLDPAEARRLALALLDHADFAQDVPCRNCGLGRVSHSGGFAAGRWASNASHNCEGFEAAVGEI